MESTVESLTMRGGVALPGGMRATWPFGLLSADSTGIQISLNRFGSWSFRTFIQGCEFIDGRATWTTTWDEVERAELGFGHVAVYRRGGGGCGFFIASVRQRADLERFLTAHGIRIEEPRGSLFSRQTRF